MKLSSIDVNNLNNELIKKIFFNVKKENYNYADYVLYMAVILKTY